MPRPPWPPFGKVGPSPEGRSISQCRTRRPEPTAKVFSSLQTNQCTIAIGESHVGDKCIAPVADLVTNDKRGEIYRITYSAATSDTVFYGLLAGAAACFVLTCIGVAIHTIRARNQKKFDKI